MISRDKFGRLSNVTHVKTIWIAANTSNAGNAPAAKGEFEIDQLTSPALVEAMGQGRALQA